MPSFTLLRPVFAVFSQSHRYRALFFDNKMKMTHATPFAAEDDRQAVEMTNLMLDGVTELWDRARLVQSFAPI